MSVIPLVVIVAQSSPSERGDVPIVTRIEAPLAGTIDIIRVLQFQADAENSGIDQTVSHTTAGALTVERRVQNAPYSIRCGMDELANDMDRHFGAHVINQLLLPQLLVARILS